MDSQLVPALRILARDIYCEDGVATQCLRDAADEIERLRLTVERFSLRSETAPNSETPAK